MLNNTLQKLLLFHLILLSFVSYGQKLPEPPTIWNPPSPVFSQQFDWLKLKSGEWLKGDIIAMFDDELEFDSDKFDNITFDWEDVEELRSRFDQQIRFDNGGVKQGFLIVKNERLVIISDGKENHYPLSELLSITSASDNRKGLWDGKVSIGVDVKIGNVDQVDYTVNARAQRRTPYTRFNAEYIYNYSKSDFKNDGQVITDNSRFDTYVDWFYSSDIFFRLFDYEHLTDVQQNIDYRNTMGLSFGYHLVNNKRLEWDVTLGPSYQETQYLTDSSDSEQQTGVVALGTNLNYAISSRIDFLFDYQLQLVEENSGKRNSHLNTSLEFELNNDFDLNLSFLLDRIAEPVASEAGVVPESNDYRLVLSLGYQF